MPCPTPDGVVAAPEHMAVGAPSEWVRRWAQTLKPGSRVLDVACGHGRHMAWLQQQGHAVTGIDRDADALRAASRWGQVVQADLEAGQPWPLLQKPIEPEISTAAHVATQVAEPSASSALSAVAPNQPGADALPETFDAVVVTNYLWRPLFPLLFASLRCGGLLIYETFSSGNEKFGRPRRPEFLLQTGELLRLALAQPNVQVLGFEEGRLTQPDRVVQSVTLWVGNSVVNSQHFRPRVMECM